MIDNNELTKEEREVFCKIMKLAESEEAKRDFPGMTTKEIAVMFLEYMETLCDE